MQCDWCGDTTDDGEGYDGLCGNCADIVQGWLDDRPDFDDEWQRARDTLETDAFWIIPIGVHPTSDYPIGPFADTIDASLEMDRRRLSDASWKIQGGLR